MNHQRLTKVLLAPIESEKSTNSSERHGQYVFRVLQDATKHEISRAVQLLFEVDVKAVQVLNVKGKRKRFGRRLGQRSDWRKAYVTIGDGQSIEAGTKP